MFSIMYSFKKNPHLFVLLMILSVTYLLVSCGKNDQKSARSGYYIVESSRGISEESSSTSKIPQIYYFFDRTTSMQGYVSKDNTEYMRIIPQLWMVAESPALWPGSETTASFFKFGEGNIRKVDRNYVRDRVRRRDFYETASDGTLVYSSGDRQVFATVAKYIASESSPDKLFIVVTDLYEQNREDNCFSALFRNAFENGMSGAIIAIESGFNGSIENISDNLAANIRVNGTSTFFLFIIGHKDILIKYCETFFSTTDFQSLETDKVLFLLGNESGSKELPWTPAIKKANSEKKLKEIAQNNNINLKEGILRLFTANGNRANDLNDAAFRLIGNNQSQYVGGLPVQNIDNSGFIYEPSFSVEYCSGGRITEGDLSTFELINDKEKENFKVTAINGSNVNGMDIGHYPLAVAVNAKNDPLNKGCYRINYEIIQRAIIPQWVTKRNAATLNELEESNKPDTVVKILRLESIYRYIAEAYNNRPEWGRVYADSLYLEKQR